MTKVVMSADDDTQLMQLCRSLDDNHIAYVLWKEMPENINTCLATVPRERNVLKGIFKHLKLFS